MKLLKISNIVKQSGEIDYKGLNIDLFVGGKQLYPHDLGFCVVETTQSNIPLHSDILEITSEEYEVIKSDIKANTPKDPMQLRLETLEATIDDIILNGGGF
jgi:hypothetical protein